MTINVGINGFGRMGRLTTRVLANNPNIAITHINDPSGSAECFAHLMQFDSVHGQWSKQASYQDNTLVLDGKHIPFTQNKEIQLSPWGQCDIVIDASGKFKSKAALAPYLEMGVKKVVVTAPVKEEGVQNIVMGVNQGEYQPEIHSIVTAASCTTNCIAPAVKVLHEKIGISHGSITTIHDITNTQTIIDAPHKDLRRARSCGTSLIPTTTGSATAITHIFKDLKGRLNGHAIRVPLTNASITDCVFEMQRATSVDEINQLLSDAADSELKGVLGFETRPLVSIDYKTDPRSSIVDALSTMVVNDTQVKLYLWYDNEWGYVNRTAELVAYVADQGL